MSQKIGYVTVLVGDYDEAISFFTNALSFSVVEDSVMSDTKRWVLVAPRGAQGTALLLAKASNLRQAGRIGDQTGGRVSFFLHTDNLAGDYQAMKSRGVRFLEEPRQEAYGKVAVFEDLYGNRWDLLELNATGVGPFK